MNALHIVAGAVAASALIAVATLAIPKPSNPITIEQDNTFMDMWRYAMVPLGFKQAQLALAPRIIPLRQPATQDSVPLDAPKPVKTETITPEVTPLSQPATRDVAHSLPTATPVPVIPKQSTDLPTVAAPYDICRGKGKRYTHNGKSWRCRK